MVSDDLQARLREGATALMSSTEYYDPNVKVVIAAVDLLREAADALARVEAERKPDGQGRDTTADAVVSSADESTGDGLSAVSTIRDYLGWTGYGDGVRPVTELQVYAALDRIENGLRLIAGGILVRREYAETMLVARALLTDTAASATEDAPQGVLPSPETQALARLAKKATPGPWKRDRKCIIKHVDGGSRDKVVVSYPYAVTTDDAPNLDFIAAANPAAVLELCDRLLAAEGALLAAEQERAVDRHEIGHLVVALETAEQERDQLREELQKARLTAGSLAVSDRRIRERERAEASLEEARQALRALLAATSALDKALTDVIGTDEYPGSLTSLHTELRLAGWAAERALAVVVSEEPPDAD